MANNDFVLENANLEQLETEANKYREIRDNATRKLREIVSEIDKRKATESVKNIVSGLSDEQRKEMYAQLVSANTASSVGVAKKGNI